jgi:chromosome segregation ATPase
MKKLLISAIIPLAINAQTGSHTVFQPLTTADDITNKNISLVTETITNDGITTVDVKTPLTTQAKNLLKNPYVISGFTAGVSAFIGAMIVHHLKSNELTQKNTDLAAAKTAHDKLKADHAAKIAELTKTKADFDAKVIELTNAKNDHDAKVIELTNAKADFDAKVIELTNANADHDAKVVELTNAKADFDAKVIELNAATNDHSSKIAEKEKSISEATAHIAQLETDLAKANSPEHVQKLNEEITRLKETHDKKESEFKDLQAIHNQIVNEKASLITESATHKSNLEKATDEHNRLNELFKNLLSDKKAVDEALSQSHEIISARDIQISNLNDEIKGFESQIVEKDNIIKAQTIEKNNLLIESNKFKTEFESKTKSYENELGAHKETKTSIKVLVNDLLSTKDKEIKAKLEDFKKNNPSQTPQKSKKDESKADPILNTTDATSST